VVLASIGLALPALGGETIEQVKARKTLRCGVLRSAFYVLVLLRLSR